MASSSSTTKYITLQSSDLKQFLVAKSIAIQSKTIKPMVEGGCSLDVIPIFNVNAKTLEMVIKYFNKHADVSVTPEELTNFDSKFVDVSVSDLFDLIKAAVYLNVPSLRKLAVKKVASLIEGKSVLEIREILNIKNPDFTNEEIENILKGIGWMFSQ